MRKNTISCLCTIRKNKDDLANTIYKYDTQYRGNISDIHNGVGDQYRIVLTGMVPLAGMPNSQICEHCPLRSVRHFLINSAKCF